MANNDIAHVVATFIDFEGEYAKLSFYLSFDNAAVDVPTLEGHVDTLIGYVEVLSNMSLSSRSISLDHVYTRVAPAKAGRYPNAEDKAFGVFMTTNGKAVKLSIPAPIDTVFEADQETIDPANATSGHSVATWIGAWTSVDEVDATFISNNDGERVTEYNFGYRRRAKGRSERPGRSKAIG